MKDEKSVSFQKPRNAHAQCVCESEGGRERESERDLLTCLYLFLNSWSSSEMYSFFMVLLHRFVSSEFVLSLRSYFLVLC